MHQAHYDFSTTQERTFRNSPLHVYQTVAREHRAREHHTAYDGAKHPRGTPIEDRMAVAGWPASGALSNLEKAIAEVRRQGHLCDTVSSFVPYDEKLGLGFLLRCNHDTFTYTFENYGRGYEFSAWCPDGNGGKVCMPIPFSHPQNSHCCVAGMEQSPGPDAAERRRIARDAFYYDSVHNYVVSGDLPWQKTLRRGQPRECLLDTPEEDRGPNLALDKSGASLNLPFGFKASGPAQITAGEVTVQGTMTIDTGLLTFTNIQISATQPNWLSWLKALPEHTLTVAGPGVSWSVSMIGASNAVRALVNCTHAYPKLF
jgi:hypothetical protein